MNLADTLNIPHDVWLAFAQAYTPENHELKNWEIRGKVGEDAPASFAVSVEDTRGDTFGLEVPIPGDVPAAIAAVRAYREINGLDCPWHDGDDPMADEPIARDLTSIINTVLTSQAKQCTLLMQYRDALGNTTKRTIAVTSTPGSESFYAHDLDKDAARQFRYSRIDSVELGGPIAGGRAALEQYRNR